MGLEDAELIVIGGGVAYVKVTCTTSTLIHYYIIRHGDSALHMGTWVSAEPSIGELRWIGRFKRTVLPDDDVGGASKTYGFTSTVEGSDVFVVGGQTRSKFYSSRRFIDDQVHCMSGTDIKACMVIPGTGYESSSGGPFFRDIDMNMDTSSNLYVYMNSNHAQTESYRMGFHGPYSCVFSRSGTPSGNMDLSFMGNMGLKGFVPVASRGYVKGSTTGVNSAKYQIVLHWYNSAAQYWAYANSAGVYTSPAMKPGTYTSVLYNGELKVATASVTITAGSTATQNLASTFRNGATTVFQIGDWDSTPSGFRNARDQVRMHPSDSRNAAWGPLTYTVGSSALSDFPMALFKSVNAPLTIKFTASAGVATLKIGTTLSFAGGRPSVTVNGKALSVPAAPTTIDSRGVTRGAYRGRGDIYQWEVSLLAGANTVSSSC